MGKREEFNPPRIIYNFYFKALKKGKRNRRESEKKKKESSFIILKLFNKKIIRVINPNDTE